MKIRYYLRGLGLGILFAAVFFLLSDSGSKQTMSDEMIKARARELGMTENTVLSDIGTTSVDNEILPTENETLSAENETLSTENETLPVENTSAEATAQEASEASEEAPESSEEASEIAENTDTAQMPQKEEMPSPEEEQNVSITVNKGEGSDTVSRRLKEAGLIEDAGEYDKYLMQNGYDKRISAGEHSIPSGADWQEIAQILCH